MPLHAPNPAWLLVVFVLSGLAGLVYQSVWSHYLGLLLGHAAYAQALVLAIFMGGMALGAAVAARASHRWRNLVRAYALVELLIGLAGLVFHGAFVGLSGLLYESLLPRIDAAAVLSAARWGLAVALILPQSVLLGMTFPLMSAGLMRRHPGLEGRRLGSLYFCNSIGAAGGALLATFVLLPAVGLPGAMQFAGLLNLVVAGAAWWLSGGRRFREPIAALRQRGTGALGANAAAAPDRYVLGIVLAATTLSGAASFVYEIVWVRMLSLAVGTTLHAFELMLAAFIAGIALGGLWIRGRADQLAVPLRYAGWMQIWMGLAALASLAVYANAFAWVGWLMQALSDSAQAYVLFNLGTAGIAMAIMLPAAFFAGTTLPLFTVTVLRAGHGEGAIGQVYAWNTLGAILGVFAAVHVLIPLLGLKLALASAALLDIAIGLALLRMLADSRHERVKLALGAAAASSALALALLAVPFDPMRLASGVFRHGAASLPEGDRVLFYRDGKTASISLVERANGQRSIATNGKVDATMRIDDRAPPSGDEPTMVLLGALPLAHHSDPRRVAVIGFGSGLSTHVLLADPRVERVHSLEIEQAMIEGARGFMPRVWRAFEDPRSTLVIDDAKAWLAASGQAFDLIVSEPSNPWISGVGTLFSQEFYRFAARRLGEGGLFVQWLQLYEIDDALVASVLRALTPAFDDYQAWLANSADLIIVASRGGLLPQADYARLLEGELGRELVAIGFEHPAQLAQRRIADARMLRALARLEDSPANSDFFPLLSLRAPETRFRRAEAHATLQLGLLPVPLLEALGIAQPLPEAVEPLRWDAHPLDQRSRIARTELRALRGEPLASATLGARLRQLAQDCSFVSQAANLTLLLRDLRALAEALVPMLPRDQQAGLWIGLLAEDCPANGAWSQALALVQAVADRDWRRSESLAQAWLDRNGPAMAVEPAFDDWARLALATAHAGRADGPALAETAAQDPSSAAAVQRLKRLLLVLATGEPL